MQKKCKHLERRMCKGKSKTKIEIFHSFIERRQTMDAINRKSPLSLPALSLSCLLSQSAIMGDLQAQASTQYCALLHTHTLTQTHTHTLLRKILLSENQFQVCYVPLSFSLALLLSFRAWSFTVFRFLLGLWALWPTRGTCQNYPVRSLSHALGNVPCWFAKKFAANSFDFRVGYKTLNRPKLSKICLN